MAQPNASAHIGASHVVVGQIQAAEDLHIAGRLQGRLDSTRTVVVEASGICEADITAQRVVILGVVIGDVQAAGEVVVEPSGQVKGTIRARNLRVRLGGRVAGSVETGVEVRLSRGITTRAAVPRSAPITRPSPAPVAEPEAEPAAAPQPEPAAAPQPEPAAAPQPEPAAAPQPEPEPEPEPEAETVVLTVAGPDELADDSGEEVTIDDDLDGTDTNDTLTEHPVVEIEADAGDSPAEVVEDDDLEGVHAP